MEDAVLPGASAHEGVEARGSATQHESYVGRSENHALRFAGGARCVDDGDGIGVADLRPIESDSGDAGKNLVEEELRRHFSFAGRRPVLLNRVAQRDVSAAEQGRRAVLY